MNTFPKLILLIVIGILLLGVFTVIGEQSGTNLTWVAAFILVVLWVAIPKKKN